MAKVPSKAEKLAALRARVASLDLGGSGGDFWSPKEGKNVVRILPAAGNMEWFFQPVGRHTMTEDGKKTVYCPKFTSEGQLECPVCDLIDKMKHGDTASKAMADQMRARKSWWMNIIVRDETEDSAKPHIFTPGVKIFDQLLGMVNDPDYGDITDLLEGFDVVIERTGTGMATEYQVRARRTPSALSEDKNKAQEWMEDSKDLTYVELTEDADEDKALRGDGALWLMPYDRIVAEYNLDGEMDEVEEVAKPAKKPLAKPAPAAKAFSKKAKVEEGTIEDPVDETEDPEYTEDVEEEPAAKTEVQRRLARRSVRR